MSSDLLMDAIAEASPVRDEVVEGLALRGADEELLREIVGADGRQFSSRLRAALRPTRTRLAFALGAVAIIVVAVTLIGVGSGGGGQQSAFAAEAIAVAESNPRLLVTAPGWRVKSADEFSEDFGQVSFTNGERYLEMWWAPASDYETFVKDRTRDDTNFYVDVLGQRSLTSVYDGARLPNFETLIPPTGPVFVAVRGVMKDREEYLSVVNSLEATDVDTWLAAMPEAVVKPDERAAVIDEMLEGIPIPPGFDRSVLDSDDAVADRYHLAARVTSYVTCRWLDSWVAATNAGDDATAQEAVDAMATAKDWPILVEIAPQGGWDEAVRQYARRLADGEVVRSVYDQEMNCIEFR